MAAKKKSQTKKTQTNKSDSTEKHFHSLRGILLPKGQHPEIRRLKREAEEPSLHGNKVWRSSAVLMDYLLDNPIKKRARVMEIGCGWGGLSCFMAKHFDARVTALDADGALAPYVEFVKSANQVKRVEFMTKRFEKITKKDLEGVHTLIGSEICFWDEMTKPLFNLIKRARAAGVKNILIADPGRTPFLSLFDLCEDKFGCDLIEHRISQPWKTSKFILQVDGK
ncbi:class I SAM-dependent methyltransferase [Gilvimarinus sp. 1_MG-2023]|uniref:class I SAM-dependent methyltransferase n=1 Tax=Gilvimarinus sp. 1_MG-2023 TaxID=3062638 RepID=UPI0026E4575E|nr:methyltransferase domain-containing protein [Gilvimarinus sp. 1_MG-2023]MDO6746114.1 methyltransferase [Gilvimarinus sp. 1_MG-2023]